MSKIDTAPLKHSRLMRISLFQKLFLALLLGFGLVITSMALLVNASFKEGFQQYLNQEEIAKVESIASEVSNYYSANNQWQRLEQSPHLWATLLQQIGGPPPRPERPSRQERPEPQASIFTPLSSRLNLLDRDGQVLLGPPKNDRIEGDMRQQRVDIVVDQQVVGYIAIAQNESLTNSLADSFQQSQTKHLLLISGSVVLLSLVFALVCTRYLLNPLRALHQGAQAVSQGNLEYKILHQSNDEIGDVTDAFNQLVESLNQQHQLREHWLSDISHELRTPLAVLRGELEALQDGLRQPEPAYIESLHQQVLTLAQLVEDLRAATKADAQFKLNRHSLDFGQLVTNIVCTHQARFEQKPLQLSWDTTTEPTLVNADQEKLTQVLNNLLENSYRYTDSEGQVKVWMEPNEQQISIIVEDSSPGVPTDSLSKLSERLYRVDQSRSRELGGSGLGLTICKNIIEAHNGSIAFEHSQLGGLKVSVTLPLTS